MAITVPKIGDVVDATTFGKPVADEVNRLSALSPGMVVGAWTTIPFKNGASVGGTGYAPACRIIGGHTVQLRGNLVGGTSGTAFGTIPVGFRPYVSAAELLGFQYNSGWIYCNVAVASNGDITYFNPPGISAATGNCSLWGLSYPLT